MDVHCLRTIFYAADGGLPELHVWIHMRHLGPTFTLQTLNQDLHLWGFSVVCQLDLLPTYKCGLIFTYKRTKYTLKEKMVQMDLAEKKESSRNSGFLVRRESTDRLRVFRELHRHFK